MSNGNNVNIVGNLTRDPELRFTPSGQATASFGVAVNRRWQNRQTQEWEEATSFFDVVCWGQLAENTAQSLARGARVVVSGRLDQRSWENQEGEKRSKIEITADEVAPSLRWATVEVTKNERRSPNGSGGETVSAAAAATTAAATRPAANVPPTGYQPYEEEPF
jgi:single-strand DNA-binding protein